MRRGRFGRLAKLGGMAAGLASDVASAAGQRVSRKAESVSDAFHAQAAQRMLGVLGEMKGLPLKAGQLLSFIDEALPEDQRHLYREALGRLQRSAPPLPWDDIEAVFREDFDGRGPADVFARFDREPIAAASIGQVYRAALADGTEVAVKVQYPGIREAMAADVANIDALVATMSTVLPKLSIRSFVHDLVARIEDELDYEAEAAAQARFAAVWADDPQVVVPAVVPELSSGRVLTSEWVDGMSWDALLATATASERSAYGLVIFRFVFGSLFRHGMFNGDPHPGNYLFLPQGRVAFIDYGCTLTYDPDRAAALRRLADTCVARDTGPAFDRAVREAFGIPADFDPELAAVLVDYVRMTVEPVTSADQPWRFTRAYSTHLIQRMITLKAQLNRKLLFGRANVDLWGMDDPSLAFLGRINFGLGSILATLETEADFNAVLAELG